MEFKKRTPSLPAQQDNVDNGMIRRPIKPMGEKFKDSMTKKDSVMMGMLLSVSVMAVFPASFVAVIPASMLYYHWASTRKYKLPFKVPATWGGTDYGAPYPGGRGFGASKGILYIGNDQTTGEELWIEDGDARRHGFFLGTTGSGKALPLDTPVLTPHGWVYNGDLRAGDLVCHPDGGTSKILSIHPQGSIPAVRLTFADGRHADCSMEHLWTVDVTPRKGYALPEEFDVGSKPMTAGDIGILIGVQGDKFSVTIPRQKPFTGVSENQAPDALCDAHLEMAVEGGLETLGYMPSLQGTPEARLDFLKRYLRRVDHQVKIEKHGVRLSRLNARDVQIIKQIAWSLGGDATSYVSKHFGKADVHVMFEGIDRIYPQASRCTFGGLYPNAVKSETRRPEPGIEITAIDRLEDNIPMSCIKTDRDDGLYVMENHIVTHNTELLLGIVSQTLMWSSGFLFIDGKGTTEFYARVWTLARRFGREDDVRVLNFTDPGGDPDAPAGGPATQSNTVNPFATGSADQLMNIVVSLMGDAGAGNDMWKNRAMSLVTAEMKALCELRDSGDILLNVQTIRDFLFLGKGIDKALTGGKNITKIEDIPEDAWAEMRTRAGLIELYLRALKGDFSNSTMLAMKGFFDTLPGFSIEKAMGGNPQDPKCLEQYGFLSMQLTKPLGSLADDYGHIFRTPLGEVDMDDVVLNRRILVVLLPALQKAPEEMQNCGKIIVTMCKIMMGNASGSQLSGSKKEIIDSKQTKSPSPYIVIMDEAGYYMVKGIDTMMAQARSLGFMIIIAGQDMAAMQSISPQIAETAAANASIFAAGKTVDGDKTVKFIQAIFGRAQVSVSSGYQAQSGMFGNKWVDRMDASFQEVDRVRVEELQHMMEGEFYFLFNGTLVRAATFYIGENFSNQISVNKFIKVRGPTDRVPGLDQEVETNYITNFVKCSEQLTLIMKNGIDADEMPEGPLDDELETCRQIASRMIRHTASSNPSSRQIQSAWLAGIMNAADATGLSARDRSQMEEDEDDLDSLYDLNDDDDLQLDMSNHDLDGSDDVFTPDRNRNAARSRKHHSLGLDDIDIEDIAARGDEGSFGDSLAAMASRETHDRHKGVMDTLESQERAVKKAKEIKQLAQKIDLADQAEREITKAASGSMADFYQSMQRSRKSVQQLLMSSNRNNETGMDLIRKSAIGIPLALDKPGGDDMLSRSLDDVEKVISE